jgi:hypothetical protein
VSSKTQQPGFRGRIGVARENITPEAGIYCRNWGAAEHDTAEGVHRRLFITTLTLQPLGGGDPLVLIDADLGWWRSLDLERKFRQQLLDRLGLDSSRLLFCLTHTHSAPPLTDQIDPDWQGGELLEPFLDDILTRTGDAVQEALESAVEATLEWQYGRCDLAQARDLDHDGRIVCGFDPAPACPPDDTLLVGRVTDADGELTAVLVNYACHPTTLAWENRLISSDFVGMMRRTIQEAEPNALALFFQGASGELAPKHQYTGDVDVADRNGRQLGHAALATLAAMEPAGQQLLFDRVVESGATLGIWRNAPAELSTQLEAEIIEVKLDLKDWPSADELETQRVAETDRALEERLRRKRDIRRNIGDGSEYSLPVWVWRIGDLVLAATMCEAYSSIQKTLREQVGDQPLLYLNLANGSVGYLPPAELYSADAYQAWQTPFASGSLEKLTTEVGGQIKA